MVQYGLSHPNMAQYGLWSDYQNGQYGSIWNVLFNMDQYGKSNFNMVQYGLSIFNMVQYGSIWFQYGSNMVANMVGPKNSNMAQYGSNMAQYGMHFPIWSNMA